FPTRRSSDLRGPAPENHLSLAPLSRRERQVETQPPAASQGCGSWLLVCRQSEESSVLMTRAYLAPAAPTNSLANPIAATPAEQPSSAVGTRRAAGLSPTRWARYTSKEPAGRVFDS